MALLGIDNFATVLALYQKVKGNEPKPFYLPYIEAGFNKGKEELKNAN